MSPKIVIVGGVAVGATTATRLRRLSETAEIIVFEKDEFISFANCGLPYHIGGVIEKREKLLLQTPGSMKQRFNLDVRNLTEIIAIDAQNKKVTARNVTDGSTYEETYDYLVLAPGAKPIIPQVPGMQEATHVFSLRNVPDTDRINKFIDEHKPAHAVVIGGGFIGLEMAENLVERGLHVSLVEMKTQVMPILDFEIAQFIHRELSDHGIDLYLGNGLKSVSDAGRTLTLQDGRQLYADMIILAIGVQPDTRLAQKAGLSKGPSGGILVNDFLQTSNPFIYAGGDAIDVQCMIAKRSTRVALAWPANRQARLIAGNIMGDRKAYPGTIGTSIIKVFESAAGKTGLSENLLKRQGITGYESIHILPNNHAGYYPGASPVLLKLTFDPVTGAILGAQAFGKEGVDKRIDVLATAIKAGLTVHDLQELELAYAPPFGSAKDPVNMLGYVASHVVDGDVEHISWKGVEDFVSKGGKVLDVRTLVEFETDHIPGSVHIPVDELRQSLQLLDPHQSYAILCAVGQRAYYSYKILQNNGFTSLKLISGGFRLYNVAMGNYSRSQKQAVVK